MSSKTTLSYCAALVREHDRDRYLCALFASVDIREAWFALFAFDYEIASIAHKVSEEMIGYIRFAWWREALDEIYGGRQVRSHPVVQALAEVITRYALPREPLDTLLEARTQDLQKEPFADLAALEQYGNDIFFALLRLCALVLKMPVPQALKPLAVAWTLTGFVRHGGQHDKTELLSAAASQLQNVQSSTLGVFKPFAVTCEFYLKRLSKGKLHENYFLLTLLLWWKC